MSDVIICCDSDIITDISIALSQTSALRNNVTARSKFTLVFAYPLGGHVLSDVTVRINLENTSLFRSGWRSPSIRTTNFYAYSFDHDH